MNSYEEKQEARRERLERAAEKARAESAQRFGAADRIGSFIPMGQPILVGHHSERRHRRDLDKIHNNMTKGVEASKRADRLEHLAATIGTHGISSDDPDAIPKLKEQIESLEQWQEMARATNKLVRKKDRAGLLALGHSEARIEQLLTPDRFQGFLGFAGYSLTNNGANIRRLKARITELEARAARAPMETITGDGWEIREDVDDNRIIISFDVRPDRTMLDALRGAGFKWSPTRGAHVRMTSNAAIYHAKRVLGVTQ